MFLQIVVKRLGLLNHLMVKLRGIEQMELSVFPNGKS